MSFYGNITNTSRTQFQFDRIYSSRSAMDKAALGDGVFIGRYVLVEYDTDVSAVYKIQVYRNDEDFDQYGYLYSAMTCNDTERIPYRLSHEIPQIDETKPYDVIYGVYRGVIVWVEEDYGRTYYQCTGNFGEYAIFQKIDENQNYVFNYTVDKRHAEEMGYSDIGRGWDSTVWQKTYVNGVSKYVMIAELNSVVPTFDISADAPSMSPVTPHFDANSTNQYYKLHWQPQWGIRLKSAYNDLQGPLLEKNGDPIENSSGIRTNFLRYYKVDNLTYPSDVDASWSKYEYDAKTDSEKEYIFSVGADNHIGTWLDVNNAEISPSLMEKAKKGYPVAIYFNKDGLNSSTVCKSSDLFDAHRLEKYNYITNITDWPNQKISDSITLTPSGFSGHTYNQHNHSFDSALEVDTLELSIMLPSIGDAISEVWDLVYGGRQTSDEIANSSIRNKDIKWYDTDEGISKTGLRLIQKSDAGFVYTPAEVETIAGCINSVHDVMGMIIHDTRRGSGMNFSDQDVINNLSINEIYYQGNAYFRKRKAYDYIKPATGAVLHEYEQINLIQFETNTYYNKILSNYILLDSASEGGKTIYSITTPPERIGTFAETYVPGVYYYRRARYPEAQPSDPLSEYYDYILDLSAIQNNDREYVSLVKRDSEGNVIYEYDNDGNISSYPTSKTVFFYKKNVYYHYTLEEGDEEPTLRLDPRETRDPNENYYYKTIIRIVDTVTYQVTYSTIYNRIAKNAIIDFEENKYYEQINGSYYLLATMPYIADPQNYTDPELQPITVFTIPYISDLTSFYQSGTYYYKTNHNDWILDTNADYTPDRIYYKSPIFAAEVNVTFYEPGIYYYGADENSLTADPINGTFQNNVTYWKKIGKYVAEDLNNIYTIGMQWNENIPVPTGVTLCNRVERWEVEELRGLANDENTMFGIILKARQMLDAGHEDTRDMTTVQGGINAINDLFSKFGSVDDGQVMIVNNYGQYAGASQTSAQQYQYTNHGTEETSNLTTSQEDQWIYWNVDSRFDRPKITIEHRNHTVSNTTTLSNLNNVVQEQNTGLNADRTNSIYLYTPIVDNMGHVVGKNTEEVTLPYGFKTISSANFSGEDAAWSQANGATASTGESVPNIVADNAQDTLSFVAGNKWIRLQANDTTDTLTFAHQTHNISETTSSSDLSSTNSTTTFTVPYVSYDIAGHFTGVLTTTYTMPDAYGIFGADSGSDTYASVVKDKMTISGDSTWISTAVTTDEITISHNNATAVTVTATTASPAFGETFSTPIYGFDSKGHKGGQSTHTVTLPTVTIASATADSGSKAAVITGLTFTSSNGNLTPKTMNVGTLLLTEYSLGTDDGALAATDTLNQALSKIEANIVKLPNTYDALGAADAVRGTSSDTKTDITVYGVKAYVDDQISATETYASNAADGVVGTSADGVNDNTIYGVKALITQEVSGLIGASTDTLNSNTIYGAKAYARSLQEIPPCPAEQLGTYVLKCSITQENPGGEYIKTYEWVLES